MGGPPPSAEGVREGGGGLYHAYSQKEGCPRLRRGRIDHTRGVRHAPSADYARGVRGVKRAPAGSGGRIVGAACELMTRKAYT